ncbi:MAG: ABC transporter ATP-binding protein/permease [Spirochaetes bacterium]|nr:ABC transporter ATP-binding protein/permease [Spirochaetota bacterium]MBU0955573.1 ABC transporter ATP-binding protein/permease [Spirochaetota bacterium]
MLRLKRFIKPYGLSLLLAIALLAIQANADLALPDYLSRIVNVGIQQGGVESPVPLVLRREQLARFGLLLSSEDLARVQAAYAADSTDAAGRLGSQEGLVNFAYEFLPEQQVYRLRDLSAADYQALEELLPQALVGLSMLSKTAGAGLPPGLVLPGADPQQALASLPQELRDQMQAAFGAQTAAMSPEMLRQAAIPAVKAEYEALGMDIITLQNSYMLKTGGLMLLLTLIQAVSVILVAYLSARIAAGLSRDLRSAVFEKVENFSSREFDKFSTASLITRSTNDIMQIQMVVVMLVRMVFYAPIIGIGGIIRAIGKSASMWWIIALAVGALSVLVLIVFVVAVPKFKLIQKLMDRLNLVSRELLSGIMVIRAFNRQDHEEARFDKANADITSVMLFVSRVMVVMMPLMMLIMNGLSILIIWVGARQIDASAMQVGDMMAFLQYAMQIVMSFLMLSMMFIMLPRAAVSADRIAEVLETEASIKDSPDAKPLPADFKATIQFDHVSFRYAAAEEDVLHDINFSAYPGQTTAIIGSTGSGKSTLVNLIPRFYDVSAGAIRLGGVDLRQLTQHELRRHIGFVPQKAVLFSGSIAGNLRYADEAAGEDELTDAVQTAQAAEFVLAEAPGLDADLAQGGINLSGGQKQRLSIARALVKKAPVYIFDDSFSALDFRTDTRLRRALKQKTSGSTIIIVSQRVATIKGADQIVVLEDGRVAACGTHSQLMENCEPYREIALSQLSAEELA